MRLRARQLDPVARELDAPARGARSTAAGRTRGGPPRGPRRRPGRRRTRARSETAGSSSLSPKPTSTTCISPATVAAQPEPGRGDEEVGEPRRAVARAVDEHEAARARAREEALGHRPQANAAADAGVDGVPALLEHPRAGLRGQRMARGDSALSSARA